MTRALILSLALMSACEQSQNAGGDRGLATTSVTDSQTFPGAYAAAYCGAAATCCSANGDPTDTAACTTKVTADMKIAIAQADAQGYPFDASAAADCVTHVAAKVQARCAGDFSEASCVFYTAPALTILNKGDSCAVDGARCADGLVCDGICVRQIATGAGDTCDTDHATSSDRRTCATGLYCQVTADADPQGVCRAPLAIGTLCPYEPNDHCVPGAHCEVDCAVNQCAWTCAPDRTAGESCKDWQCDANSWCNDATQTCVADKTVGEACDPASDQCTKSVCYRGECRDAPYFYSGVGAACVGDGMTWLE